jgi:hypothetical protein
MMNATAMIKNKALSANRRVPSTHPQIRAMTDVGGLYGESTI